MRKGILKFFNRKAKFGFVVDEETGEEFLVTFRSLPKVARHKRLPENIPVTFEVLKDAPEEGKLPLAGNIQFLDKEGDSDNE